MGRALRAPPRRPGGARFTRPTLQLACLPLLAAVCQAADAPPAKTYGWRGNWTGLYPDANPPAEWGRTPKRRPGRHDLPGGQAGRRRGPERPAGRQGPRSATGSHRPASRSQDSAKDLAKEQIPGEAELAPQAGDKAGDLAWQRVEIKKKPDYEVWGTTELDWLDPGEVLGFKPNAMAYAFTYLYAQRAGKAVMVVDHGHGLKVWLNGTVVYENADRGMGLGNYVGISRQKQELVHSKSPKFELPLKQGWNRLLRQGLQPSAEHRGTRCSSPRGSTIPTPPPTRRRTSPG